MDFIKSQFERIQQQLSGLTPSQKMLSAALVTIMVMTLWWWGRYASQPEMEALLDQALSAEELTRVDMQLTGANILHKVGTDNKIYVAPENKVQAIALLSYANVLPKNLSNGFDEMIKQLTAWDGQDRQNAIFNHGKELSLERVIAAYPGVASASVFIDPKPRRAIGHDIEPTATVNVATREAGGNSKQLATAVANLVSGSQAGLSPSRVKVIINGRVLTVRDPGEAGDGMQAENILETQQIAEAMLTQKLEHHLNYIDGVRVSVTVKVNGTSETEDAVTYDKDKSLITEQELTNKTREDASGANTPLEAGTVPNTGAAIANAGGGSTRSNNETIETIKNAILPASKRVQSRRAAGETTPIGASVRVPRSYFAMIAKGPDAAAKEPDAATVDRVISQELPNIQKAVIACTGIAQATSITVEPFADIVMASPNGPQVATASTVTLMLGGHIKEIALGVLAVASLFMMSMIVRKGAPAPIITPVAAPVVQSSNVLGSSEDVAGEASESAPTLDGMELDEDSIKTQQMMAQVANLVGDSPESAASLIKRWMNQR